MASEKNTGNEQAPRPDRRRLLKRVGLVAVGLVATDQLPPFLFWHDNQTRIEHDNITTSGLALVMPGIGRKHAKDIVGTLRPSLEDKNTTLASLSYSDQGLDAKAAAEAIRRSGCTQLTLVGHSLGGGFSTEVIEHLRDDILNGRIAKPNLILLSTAFDGKNVQNGLAKPMSRWPLGFITKSLADLAAFGGFNKNSVRLEASELDQAVDYNGANVAPGITDLIDRALYIGDAYPDGVIDTPSASEHFKAVWGDRLTVELVPGLGHPDPAKDDRQARVYNEVISDWLAA